MSQDAETIRQYDARAQDYAELTKRNRPDPVLAAFIEALPKEGHVLDIGCGPGHDATLMARAGLRVLALDASAEMVALAACHRDIIARQSSFADLGTLRTALPQEIPTGGFDGIWANFSLLHAPRTALPSHLSDIKSLLRPGGRFHIAVKTGTGEARDRLGRYYSYYQAPELVTLLAQAGLQVTEMHHGRDTGLSGEMANWVALCAYG